MEMEHYQPAETTRILSTNGVVIATLFDENRVYTSLDEISPHVVEALLAIEDSRFYDHLGVDPVGVARAISVALSSGQVREGASTITMQLARNLFLTNDPTLARKIREILLALEIERHYEKDKILEVYLNQVFFGEASYGVHAAARTFFNKGSDQLSQAESALLVGLLQAPSRFSPLKNPEAARTRQGQVLARMRELSLLTEQEYKRAIEEADSMTFEGVEQRRFGVLKYPYFTSYVIKELSGRYPEETLYRGGLTIVTTLDPELQTRAEEVVRRRVSQLGPVLNVNNGAAVLLENETGYIRALVGGVGWSEENQFNRAWQARRQPGSAFKAIVYAAALEEGYTPASEVEDTKTSYQDGSGRTWSPKNSDGRFLGRITLRQAITGSRNVAAVKLASQVGLDRIISLAYKLGIEARIPSSLSIALGAVDATPLEMARVYQVFANRGMDRRPTAIKLVKSSNGIVHEDGRHRIGDRILSNQVALAMISLLTDVVEGGTGRGARIQGHPIAGKTGTTDSFRDAWFCGFSPYYTLAVWVGNDDNTSMWRSFGGDLPASTFSEIMTFAHQGKRRREFPDYTPEAKEVKHVTPAPAPQPTPVEEELDQEPSPEPEESSFQEPEPWEGEAPLPERVELDEWEASSPNVVPTSPTESSPGWFDEGDG